MVRSSTVIVLMEPLVIKEDTNYRKSISPAEHLALTIRFLATGESQISLSFSFRRGKSTVSKITAENCDALHPVFFPPYVKPPLSNNVWKAISQEFEDLLNLPHPIGAIDGKHVRIECPKNSGTLYHNYKGFFSLVLLVICDARNCFTS